jgi:transcriptional regulator with XRE-family HTH domain
MSAELMNKEYRHGLVNAQIEVDLPLQIRALRKQLVGTQPDLSKLTGMKQPRISAMEKPGGAHFTLETLKRLAEAFDVALIVRFAPFGELLNWSGKFNPDTFQVPNFAAEMAAAEEDAKLKKQAVFATTVVTSGDLSWLGNSQEVADQAAVYAKQRCMEFSKPTSLNQLGLIGSTIATTGPREIASDPELAMYKSQTSPTPINIDTGRRHQHRRNRPRRQQARRVRYAG